MTRLFKHALLIVSALFTFSASAADDAISTGFFNNVALGGYDSVAYFTESKAIKGTKKYAFTWRDATWRFSSAENLARFKTSPNKYAPQYGGYCAWAMSAGKTASVDPEVWHIEEGKLYLNYNKKVQSEWFTTLAADIVSADKYYPEVTNVAKYTD